jgi:hypothetical protein
VRALHRTHPDGNGFAPIAAIRSFLRQLRPQARQQA